MVQLSEVLVVLGVVAGKRTVAVALSAGVGWNQALFKQGFNNHDASRAAATANIRIGPKAAGNPAPLPGREYDPGSFAGLGIVSTETILQAFSYYSARIISN